MATDGSSSSSSFFSLGATLLKRAMVTVGWGINNGSSGIDPLPPWCIGAAAGCIGYFTLYGASKVYCRSKALAPLWITESYAALKNDAARADWDSRLPSMVHSLFCVLGMYYPSFHLAASGSDGRVNFYDDRMYVEYGITGIGPEFFCAMFVSYLLSDLSIIAYHAIFKREQVPNFVPMVAHHTSAAIAWSSIIATRRFQWYGCFWMIAELSTLFVNIRMWLYECNLKHTKFYFYNGCLMTLSFFLVRVATLPFTTYIFFTSDRQVLAAQDARQATLMTGCFIFNGLLQSYWFSLMVKGVLKAIRNGRKDESKKKS